MFFEIWASCAKNLRASSWWSSESAQIQFMQNSFPCVCDSLDPVTRQWCHFKETGPCLFFVTWSKIKPISSLGVGFIWTRPSINTGLRALTLLLAASPACPPSGALTPPPTSHRADSHLHIPSKQSVTSQLWIVLGFVLCQIFVISMVCTLCVSVCVDCDCNDKAC